MRKVCSRRYISAKNRALREFGLCLEVIVFIFGVYSGWWVWWRTQTVLGVISWWICDLINNYFLWAVFLAVIILLTVRYNKKKRYWSHDYRRGYKEGLKEGAFRAMRDILGLGNGLFSIYVFGFIIGWSILGFFLKIPIPF